MQLQATESSLLHTLSCIIYQSRYPASRTRSEPYIMTEHSIEQNAINAAGISSELFD